MNVATLTVSALLGGLNPCGIGLMVMFLGYLLVFGVQNKKGQSRVLRLGLIYIASVFMSYLLVGLFFYNLAFFLQRTVLARYLFRIAGGGVIFFGILQLIGGFWPDSSLKVRMPEGLDKQFGRLMSRSNVYVAILAGMLTTLMGSPCMMPLYVGTAIAIANSGLGIPKLLMLFLYYNVVFVSPLVVVLILVERGKELMLLKEWEHKSERWIRLILGALMLVVGGWLFKR